MITLYRAREVGPSEIIHVHGLRGTGACSRAASAGLIIVDLGDEDWEGHVVCADVAPGNVLREALATRPALESCSIWSCSHCDIVKMDVGNISEAVWV